MNHELVLLRNRIGWEEVESDFAEYYCADNCRMSVPIRTMVGMMLLKSIYNLSDEGVVARWLENPYMQFFVGEEVFRKHARLELVIGHLKLDYRMMRNYHKGTFGDAINTRMAAKYGGRLDKLLGVTSFVDIRI